MTVGVVGLGLIGGSLAKAVKDFTNHRVFGFDISEKTILEAKLFGAVDSTLYDKNIGECDFVIISIYPNDAVDYIKKRAKIFKKGALVVDCCGVKRTICSEINPVAKKNGFVFIGGHPMAGTQHWGFRYSRGTLFKSASMLLCPPNNADIADLNKAKHFFLGLGFGEVVFTSPEEHDRIIAHTSQLPHAASSAYIKSAAAVEHRGFSASSYRDLSRVAKLNEDLWCELFLENSDMLTAEIDGFIDNLVAYRDAISEKDAQKLRELLKDGRERKEKIEKKGPRVG